MQDYFFIRTDNKYLKINFQEILYVEAYRNYIRIVTTSKAYIALLSLKQLEKALPSERFCRVHRSYIVSLNAIIAFDHELVFLENKQIPLGSQYKKRLQSTILLVLSETRSGIRKTMARCMHPEDR